MHLIPCCQVLLRFVCVMALWDSIAKADDGATNRKAAPSLVGTNAGQVRDDNGLNLKLVWCPPGSFTMGSPANEIGRGDDENQVHVTLAKGFWMGRHEVTQAEWQRVIQTTPWSATPGGGIVFVKQGNDYPTVAVSWEDAMKFCERLTEQERRAGRLPAGWQYTLPTEAQWEYACRGGSNARFSFGEEESRLSDYAWWGVLFGNTSAKREEYAHQVGQKKANPLGLSDMHGNVYEWCRDWYVNVLPGGIDPQGPSAGKARVIRGGSWVDPAAFCRSADRSRGKPDFRSSDLGFRLAIVSSGK